MTIAVSDTLPFNYELTFSRRRRSVQLAIVQGQLKVKAPTGTSMQFLQQLLKQKQAWVLKHLQASAAAVQPRWLERTDILIGGEQFSFNWQLAAKGNVKLSERSLQIQVPTRVKIDRREIYIAQILQRYFTAKAEVFFALQVQHHAQQMAVAPTAIRIGNWQRRWGCCDNRGVVGFNWRLLQAPEWVAHYVVIHELAHLRYMDHSAAFWQLVKHYCPEYAKAQLWLKQHQKQLL